MLCTGAHVTLQVGKVNQLSVRELWEHSASTNSRGSFLLAMMGARHLCTIARILTQDNLPASRQGIQKFLKKYIQRVADAIGRQEGLGKKPKIRNCRSAVIVDEKLMKDELRTKLNRSSSKVGLKFEQTLTGVRAKLDRSLSEVGLKFEQSSFCKVRFEVETYILCLPYIFSINWKMAAKPTTSEGARSGIE